MVLLAAAFLFGLAGVVYMSLQGEELQVPEITGKNFEESEKELASLGLKIKKRADRFSVEVPNTVIEQLPKPGETVKTGQMIYVVTSKGPGEGDDKNATLKKLEIDEDESDRIEELIDDKPKKPKATNSNRKKADTSRDVSGNTATNSSSPDSNSNKSGSNNNSSEKPKNTQPAGPKPAAGGDGKPKPPSRP